MSQCVAECCSVLQSLQPKSYRPTKQPYLFEKRPRKEFARTVNESEFTIKHTTCLSLYPRMSNLLRICTCEKRRICVERVVYMWIHYQIYNMSFALSENVKLTTYIYIYMHAHIYSYHIYIYTCNNAGRAMWKRVQYTTCDLANHVSYIYIYVVHVYMHVIYDVYVYMHVYIYMYWCMKVNSQSNIQHVCHMTRPTTFHVYDVYIYLHVYIYMHGWMQVNSLSNIQHVFHITRLTTFHAYIYI